MPSNSPGLRPMGVLENEQVLFLVKPPLPPQQAVWLRKSMCFAQANLPQPSLGSLFSNVLSTPFFTWFLVAFLDQKSSQNWSKIDLKIRISASLRWLVFWVWFGKVNFVKIIVSCKRNAHFWRSKGSKKHPQKHPKNTKNHEKLCSKTCCFFSLKKTRFVCNSGPKN